MMSTNKVCTTPQRTYCAGGGGTTTTTTTLRRAPAFDAGHKPATAVFGSSTATTPIPPSPFQPMFSRCMMLSPSHDDDGEDDEEETHGIFRATKQPHHQHHHFEQEQSKMYPRDQDSSHSKPPTNQDSIRGTASTEGRYRGNLLVNHVTDVFKALPKLDWYTRDITASTTQGGTTTRSEKSRHPSSSSKSKPCSSSRLDQDRDQHAPSTAGAAPRRSTTAATSTTATGHRIHKIRTNQDDRSRPIPSKETTPQRSDDALSLVNLLREANFGFTSSATGTTASTANQYLYREDSIRTEQPSPQPRVQHRPTNVRFGSRQPPREQGVGFRGDSSGTNQNAFPILPDTTSKATGGGGSSSTTTTRTARTSSKCTAFSPSSHLQQPSPRVQDSRRKDCGGTSCTGPATAWYAINPVVARERLTNTKTLSRAEGNLNKSHNECHNTTQCTTTKAYNTDTNMMTSTRRNIYNLHRNASDPEFDEDGLASRQGGASTQSRPRSRAIAIRRNTRSTKAMARNNSDTTVTSASSPEDEDDSMQQMYDYATWRLYHRIVDHRMKHPLTQSYYDLNAAAAAEAANAAKANCDASPSQREQDPSSSIPHAASYYYYNGVMMPVVPPPANLQDKIYDGEVFDLEL